jgi:hypothetical protein
VIRVAEVELVLERTPSVAIACVCLRLVLMRTPYQELLRDIEFLAQRMTIYYNNKKFRESYLMEENKIYLLRRNIKTTRLNDKLNYKKFGPFTIK